MGNRVNSRSLGSRACSAHQLARAESSSFGSQTLGTPLAGSDHCSAVRQQNHNLLHLAGRGHQISINNGSHLNSPALRRPLEYYNPPMLYIPGMINVEADALSWGKVVQDWSLRPDLAQTLFRIWSRPEIDLFALSEAHLLPHYFTIHRHDPAALALDALHQNWSFNHLYAFPPPQLIPLTLAKLAESQASMILITPWWTEAMWLE